MFIKDYSVFILSEEPEEQEELEDELVEELRELNSDPLDTVDQNQVFEHLHKIDLFCFGELQYRHQLTQILDVTDFSRDLILPKSF